MTDPSLVAAWRVSVAELENSVGRRVQMHNCSRDNQMRLQWELDLVRLSVSAPLLTVAKSSCLTDPPRLSFKSVTAVSTMVLGVSLSCLRAR